MTIEIRQLVIRAEVISGDRSSPPLAGSGRGRDSGPWTGELPASDASRPELRQEELVEACVRQVLRRLARHRDR